MEKMDEHQTQGKRGEGSIFRGIDIIVLSPSLDNQNQLRKTMGLPFTVFPKQGCTLQANIVIVSDTVSYCLSRRKVNKKVEENSLSHNFEQFKLDNWDRPVDGQE